MASALAAAAARSYRPVCKRQILALLPAYRTFHGSATVQKKKRAKNAAYIENLFDDERPADSRAMQNGSSSSLDTSAPALKKSKLQLSGQQRNAATFDELYDFIKHHITHKPTALEPEQMRHSAWFHVFEAASSEAELRRTAELFADWVGMGRKFRDDQIMAFVGRCHKLGCPNLAVEIFSNRPYYRLDLPNTHAARELLHSVQTKESAFELSVVISALYTLYKLPPLVEDMTSCAMLLAQCLRTDTPTARTLAETLLPAFKQHVKNSPTIPVPHNHILRRQGKLRELTWLQISAGTIDNTLRDRGEDREWLHQWRIASGHLPSKKETGGTRSAATLGDIFKSEESASAKTMTI